MYTNEILKRLENHTQLLIKLTAKLTSETTRNRTLVSQKSDHMSAGNFAEVIGLGKEIRDSDDLLLILQEQIDQATRNNPLTIDFLQSEWAVYSQSLIKKAEKADADTEKAFLAYVAELQKQGKLLVELRGEAASWNRLANEVAPKNTTSDRFRYNGRTLYGTARTLYNGRWNRLDAHGELVKK